MTEAADVTAAIHVTSSSAASGRARPAAAVVPGSIGLLGGTFDPIHIGHLAIAEEVREVLGLERVLFVPAGEPPHKVGRAITGGDHRAAMVELAIAGDPWFELSRIELDRPGPSYAVDTLDALHAAARAAGRVPDFTFILSEEAAAELPAWREPRRLLGLCRFAVVPRGGRGTLPPGWATDTFPGLEDRFVFLGGPGLAVSASEIRERGALGRSIRFLVPEAVIAYIDDHHLHASRPTPMPMPAPARQAERRSAPADPADHLARRRRNHPS